MLIEMQTVKAVLARLENKVKILLEVELKAACVTVWQKNNLGCTEICVGLSLK